MRVSSWSYLPDGQCCRPQCCSSHRKSQHSSALNTQRSRPGTGESENDIFWRKSATDHICWSLTDDSLLSDLLCPEAVLAELGLPPAVLGDVPEPHHLLGGADWNGEVLTGPARFLSDGLYQCAVDTLGQKLQGIIHWLFILNSHTECFYCLLIWN